MLTLHFNIQRWVLLNLKLTCIGLIAVLFSFSANAQLPGQLPVNLKAFKARAENNNKAKVFWTTEYEKDNGYFDIERSVDGVNFKAVGRVTGVNNNGVLTDYVFYDHNCLKGISFYRLKQVDIDTKFSYSPIERVKNADTENSFDVFPNPATGSAFKINVFKNSSADIDVQVFDNCGRLKINQHFSNSNTITINHYLPAGIYLLKIKGTDFAETKSLVIQ